MGNLFPPPAGSSTPIPTKAPKINLDKEFTAITEIKEKKQRRNKERDLLIECKALLNQLKDYKALNGKRTTGTRIKELLVKIEAVLE